MSSSSTSVAPVSGAAGQIELDGGGARNSAGNALTLVDGRTGAGSPRSRSNAATAAPCRQQSPAVWYLAWWDEVDVPEGRGCRLRVAHRRPEDGVGAGDGVDVSEVAGAGVGLGEIAMRPKPVVWGTLVRGQ